MAVILASTSNIRRQLLHNAGIAAVTEDPRVDEQMFKTAHQASAPDDLAQSLAAAKAQAVSERYHSSLVVGADQVLSINGTVLGKPRSLAEARSQLQRLRDETHMLSSAICCGAEHCLVWSYTGRAELTMRNFSDCFLDDYLASLGSDALTSVGAYKLEGRGIQLFNRVHGDYFSIMGLPLLPLIEFLRSAGELTQ